MDAPPQNRWSTFPRILWLSLLAAGLLTLPTVGMGFFNDDYGHLLLLEGWTDTLGSRWDLFNFAGGDPESMRHMVADGTYPWWTLPELKLAFWRPLSSALAVLDYELFGRNAVGWHLHSVAWYLGTVAIVGMLLRRLLPGALGALALFLFAIDGSHFLVVGWLANRNALVAALPALLGLWMHVEWREHQRTWAWPLSLAGLAVGLLGGESALGVFAYVLAYEVLGNRGSLKERARAIAPVALLGLAYLVMYKLRGYGSQGSGSYLDPLSESGRFFMGATARVPTLLGGLILEVPSDLWVLDTRSRPVLVLLGWLAIGLLVGLVRAAWSDLSPTERRHCGWLFLGALLSLLPVAATFPSQRLLLLPGLGGMVAVAVVLVKAWRSRALGWRPRGLAAGAGVLALSHFVLAPLFWPLMTFSVNRMNAHIEPVARSLERELDYTRLPEQRVAVLPLPVPTVTMYLPMIMATRGMPKPRAWWTLSLAPHPHVLTRTGPTAFELSLTQGQFLTSEFETLFRSHRHPLPPGAQVDLQGLTVTVEEVDAQGPTRLSFVFDTSLEDPSLVLLQWRDGMLHRFTPPRVGERVAL